MSLVAPQKVAGRVGGLLGNWGTYTPRDLVDEVYSDYRTVRAKAGRAIAGYSEDGYGAINLGLNRTPKPEEASRRLSDRVYGIRGIRGGVPLSFVTNSLIKSSSIFYPSLIILLGCSGKLSFVVAW